jgi:hypothetical protein
MSPEAIHTLDPDPGPKPVVDRTTDLADDVARIQSRSCSAQ